MIPKPSFLQTKDVSMNDDTKLNKQTNKKFGGPAYFHNNYSHLPPQNRSDHRGRFHSQHNDKKTIRVIYLLLLLNF